MRTERCVVSAITDQRCGDFSEELQDELFPPPRELMLALYKDKEGTAEEKLGIYFDMYDVDKNSVLDMKEIKKMITAIKSQVLCQTVTYQMTHLK